MLLRVLICIIFSQTSMSRVLRHVKHKHTMRNESQVCPVTDERSPGLISRLLNAEIFRPFQTERENVEDEVPESPLDVCDQTFLSSINGEAVHLPVSRRALCPWSYQIDYDANRWPRKLPVAYCLCDNVKEKMAESFEASSSNDDQKLNLNSLHRNYECELIYMKVKVLKFQCTDDDENQTITDDFEDVPVACAAIGQTVPLANVGGNLKSENGASPPVEY